MKYLSSPLAKKMLLIILLVSSIITLIMIVIQIFFEYRSEISHIEKRIKQIDSSYIEPLTLSIWTFDKSQYKAQINGILNIQDISYVEIILDNNKTLISKGIKSSNHKITKEFRLQRSIFDKEIYLGRLIVEASLNRVYDDLYNRVLVILLTQGIKTLIISFTILYLFHIIVTRHLYVIANHTKDIDLSKRLILDKNYDNDELDYISSAINSMQQKLLLKQNELKSLNELLEIKVAKRTQKLQELMFVQNRMASMGKMIENIAHQWRQPLHSINSSVLLIDRKISTKDINIDSINKDLDSIESVTLYLSKTIDDIRDFYSKDKVKKEFYIYEVVNSSINIISNLLQKSQISISKNFDKSIKVVNYPNELQQVLLSI